MRKHNGMRPQDIVVLLRILTLHSTTWKGKDLAAALSISPAEISDALRRCQYARLLHADGRTVQHQGVLRFLEFGLPYVFPVHPSGFVRGVSTTWSVLPELLPQSGLAQPHYVWPDPAGTAWGLAVTPLYPTLPATVRLDDSWHQLLAAVDVLRLGTGTQHKLAYEFLSERLRRVE